MAKWLPASGNAKVMVSDPNNPTSYIAHATTPNLAVSELDDNKSGERTFEIGEAIEISNSGSTIGYAVFLGTITVDGITYPVLGASGNIIIAGISASDPTPDLGTRNDDGYPSNIDRTGSFTVCFFPGTIIATLRGECKVEDLVPGDLILVEDAHSVPATWTGRMAQKFRRRFGFRRAVPVKWVGRQTVSTLFGPAERLMPVRLAAGSRGGGGGATA